MKPMHHHVKLLHHHVKLMHHHARERRNHHGHEQRNHHDHPGWLKPWVRPQPQMLCWPPAAQPEQPLPIVGQPQLVRVPQPAVLPRTISRL